jgi:hypothetical protein
VGHLREFGFEVRLIEVDNIADLQEQHGIPSEFRGCHSSEVGDHMVEGHVPADLLKRFLENDEGWGGITVPGMVVGPPGMEGREPVPFDVLTFDRDGTSKLYESRPGLVRESN